MSIRELAVNSQIWKRRVKHHIVFNPTLKVAGKIIDNPYPDRVSPDTGNRMVFYPLELTNPHLWLGIIAWMAFFAFASAPIVMYLEKLKQGNREQQRISYWLKVAYLFILVGGGGALCLIVVQSS